MTDKNTEKITDRKPKISNRKPRAKAEMAETASVEQAMTYETPAETVKVPEAQYIPMYVQPTEKMVKGIIIDSCIKNNEYPLGNGRKLTGSGKVFSVPVSEFESTFITPFVAKLIEKKIIIILDGLTDEQREQYGCLYGEGDVIRSEGMFDWFLSKDVSEITEAFENLCIEHKELVARRFYDAFEKGDNRISRDRVVALNDISKKDYEDGKGAFTEILAALNAKSL